MVFILDVGQDREALAAWRLLQTPGAEYALESFGIASDGGHQWWALLRFPLPCAENDPLVADADILAGHLVPKVHSSSAANSRIVDLPNCYAALDLTYLVALEVKCALMTRPHQPEPGKWKSELRSTHTSESHNAQILRQVQSLLDWGADRVGLLDIFAGPPAPGPNLSDGFPVMGLASQAASKHERVQEATSFIPPGSGYAAVQIGSILDAEEHVAGGTSLLRNVPAPFNPRLADPSVRSRRERLEVEVRRLLSGLSIPCIFGPLIRDYCKRCKRLGVFHSETECAAPQT